MLFSTRLSLFSLMLAFLLAGQLPARAGESDEGKSGGSESFELMLPPVTVTSEVGSPLNPGAFAERARLEQVPGATNLIRPQEKDRMMTLEDALGSQPGV